jgi:tmRNA-binding protein
MTSPILIDELSQLISAFERDEVEYAVCGSLALAVHGFVRATLDIDILIQRDSIDKVYKIAEETGYDIHGLDISFKKSGIEIHRITKIDSSGEALPLDLIPVTLELRETWEDRESVEFMDQRLSVVSRSSLIKMKILSGRPQHLIDVERLETEKSSARTVTRRLAQVGQLRQLCLSLMKAKKVDDRRQTESDGPKNDRDKPGK